MSAHEGVKCVLREAHGRQANGDTGTAQNVEQRAGERVISETKPQGVVSFRCVKLHPRRKMGQEHAVQPGVIQIELPSERVGHVVM